MIKLASPKKQNVLMAQSGIQMIAKSERKVMKWLGKMQNTLISILLLKIPDEFG